MSSNRHYIKTSPKTPELLTECTVSMVVIDCRDDNGSENEGKRQRLTHICFSKSRFCHHQNHNLAMS